MMPTIKYTLILLTIFINKTTPITCEFNVKLIQTLHNDGFHRNITYEIEYGAHGDQTRWYEGCSVGLEQVLPSSLYSSPDEIDELRYKTTTVFKSKVDIEASAEQASPITVHLLGSVRDHRTVLFLPVHARYHKAVTGGGSARVDIPPPQLYLNCGPKKLDKCDNISARNSFCPHGNKYKCLWKQVPIMVSGPLGWPVPRADARHRGLALLGTAAVLVFGAVYILKEIHCFKMRQRKI